MPLVTTKEMFEKAYNGGYAIGAFNVNNMEIIQGITEAAAELKAPLILQVSKGARAYANRTYLKKLVEAAVIETGLPIALHLDHGDSFELCKSCIEDGFTSVMIDASSKPFAENIALTRQVVEYAHDHGVVVEAELGTPLFDRVGKTVRLTDAGQTFLGYARTLLETAQQAQAALQPAQQVRGSLRIALADSVCSTFLPELLQRYHARCPQVELVLHTASTDEMLQLLSTNQVDLVYTLDQPLLQPALVLAADVPEPVCFIAPPPHPLAQESVLPLDILPRQEFLLTERGMSYRDALDQCMAAHGLAIHPYLELGSAALLCQMVEQGMGLSFLPEYIVRSALAEGRLARLNVPDCTVMMHRQLFYHRDKWVTPQMNVFIELVRQGTQTK